jgi:hypothetical protein
MTSGIFLSFPGRARDAAFSFQPLAFRSGCHRGLNGSAPFVEKQLLALSCLFVLRAVKAKPAQYALRNRKGKSRP